MTPPLPDDLESLLVVAPSWVGDTVMATPVFRATRERLPDTRLVAALRPGLADLVRGAPWFDEVITVPKGGLTGPLRASRIMKRARPQAALLLTNSLRSALAVRLAGPRTRVGYDRDRRGTLLTHRLAPPTGAEPTPAVDSYARLASYALGGEITDLRLELFVTDEEEQRAAAALAGVEGSFVLMTPGGVRAEKRWPATRFAAVADALAQTHGLRTVVSGAPAETDLLDAVTQAARSPIVNVSTRASGPGLGLGPLKAVVRRAALMITNDTGPRHVAAALETPLVSLFGPTDHRWTTLDGIREQVVLAEPFLPQELVADRHPSACRIDRIPVGDVLFAVNRLLS